MVLCHSYPYKLRVLVDLLTSTIPDLRLWAAGIHDANIPPALQRMLLTLALRAAPDLVMEVQAGFSSDGSVPAYSLGGHAPCGGAGVWTVLHGGPGHAPGDWPKDCGECGRQTARLLLNLLVTSTQGEGRPSTFRHFGFILVSSEFKHIRMIRYLKCKNVS